MKRFLMTFWILSISFQSSSAQLGGGAATYGRDRVDNSAPAAERAKRVVTKDEMPPSATSMYLDASVLINVKADEFVAVFAVNQESATLEEARRKIAETIGQFTSDLKQLGVGAKDMYVDFVAQNRIFGFEVEGDLAKEKVVGFEVKKNVSIHYRSEPLLEQYLAAASKVGIFDLVKVDYIVKDPGAVHTRLMELAARVVKRKAAIHQKLLGIALKQPPQVYAERYSSYYPTDAYSSYVAQESEDVSAAFNRQRFTIQRARKPATFYFDGLSGKVFDHVENPALIEPVVQFSLYLKVNYEMARPTSSTSRGTFRGTSRPSGR